MALGRVGFLETWALDVTPGVLERGVAIEERLERPLSCFDSPRLFLAIRWYEQLDDLVAASAALEQIETAATERGDEQSRSLVTLLQIACAWYAGRWDEALRYAEWAREWSEHTQDAVYAARLGRFLGVLQADLGLLEDARRTAADALELARSVGDEGIVIGNLRALGHAELVAGDLPAAAAHLRGLPERLLRTGHIDPGSGPWADTIETLIGLGDLDPARALLRRYEKLCTRASRWSQIGCARCRGLLAAAEGDTATALESYELALAVDPARTHELERGRTLLALGALHRHERHNRSARDALQEAAGIFGGLGAELWAAKAYGELGRIGGRRPPDETLTGAERRVASLAAEGRHNKEIAAELFIAVKTVEAHLSRAYSKLGVRSRTELARHIAKQGMRR